MGLLLLAGMDGVAKVSVNAHAPTAAQVTGATPATSLPATDPVLAAAENWIGRALILRAFAAGDVLEYDGNGKLKQPGKAVDWTLAGMELDKVVRRPDGQLELDGTRVAILYKPDQHSFERHALKQTRLRVVFPPTGPAGVERVLRAIFSVGIDPALERSLPPYWSHYFLPALDWGDDGLKGVSIVPAAGKLPDGAVAAVALKKVEPEYTDEARADRVKGLVGLRLVIDATGAVKRVTVRQPLGYGLDARAAEAVGRWQFQPGTVDGKPAAMELLVNQGFEFGGSPR